MSRQITKNLTVKDLILIILGSTILSISVKYIFDPIGLVTGGVSGLSIVIRHVSEQAGGYVIPLWLGNLVLNLPIFLFAWKTEGFRSIMRTSISFVLMTIELYLFPDAELFTDNLLLASIYGGIGFGVGTGLLLSARSTSGGTDMLGNTLSHYIRHVSVGTLVEILDGCVVVVGAFVFGLEHTLYAIISVFVMGTLIDYVLDSRKKAKIAMIISPAWKQISDAIMTDLDRGVTGLAVKGMYTKDNKDALICVCTVRDVPLIKDIVKSYDENAFFVVGNINEVIGEGFIEHWT